MTDPEVFRMAHMILSGKPHLKFFDVLRLTKWAADSTNMIFDLTDAESIKRISSFVEHELRADSQELA